MSLAIDRVAVLSDVHANLTALEAVLADIAARGITRIFNLGDLVGKGPRPCEVVDRCRAISELVVQGNWDADVSANKSTRDGPRWHHERLGAERNAYLAGLPGSLDCRIGQIDARFYHASQISPFHRIYASAPRRAHEAMFSNTDFTGNQTQPKLIGYGDIHTAYCLSFEGRTLFNAGSVGNPLDMPLASYAILEASQTTTIHTLAFVRVPYDIEAELACARKIGMPDFDHYAKELRTAVYRGLT